MAGGRDKVQAAVNPVVHDVLAVDAALLVQERVEALVDALGDGLPAEEGDKGRAGGARNEGPLDGARAPVCADLASLLMKSP